MGFLGGGEGRGGGEEGALQGDGVQEPDENTTAHYISIYPPPQGPQKRNPSSHKTPHPPYPAHYTSNLLREAIYLSLFPLREIFFWWRTGRLVNPIFGAMVSEYLGGVWKIEERRERDKRGGFA